MVTKELFIEQIKLAKEYDNYLDSIDNDLKIDLFETPLYQTPMKMFDIFIESHFTNEGQDLIYWWMWEDVPKVLYFDTMFGESKIDLENIEDLWRYLESDEELYFK